MDHRELYKAGPIAANKKKITARSQAAHTAHRALVRQNAFDNYREIVSEEDAHIEPVLPTITKQQQHYNKFLEWRKRKQEQDKANVPRRRPFTSAVPRNKFLSPQAGLLTNRTLRVDLKPTGFMVTNMAAPVLATAVSPPLTRARRAALLASMPQTSRSETPITVKNATVKQKKATQKFTRELTKAPIRVDAIIEANQNVFKPPLVLEPRSVRNLPSKPVMETKSITSLNVPVTPSGISFGALASSTAQKTSRRQTPAARIEELFSPIDNSNVQIRKTYVNNPAAATPEPLIVDLDVTPLNRSAAAETSNHYVSPFVTTARGKRSSRKERQHRDSVYLLELNQSIEEPVENRRRKEAALYFRGQVDDESNRLLSIVAGWEDYKAQHIDVLESEYIDQIDVAVGQTRLLVTKKFNQFRTLVDQCEACIEQAQPVLAEDLEGFWSMVNMQVENCDKRFNKLTTLKANNWIDVEITPIVNTGAIRKVRKVKQQNVTQSLKGGHNEFVMQLKKIQADFKLKKQQERTQATFVTPRFVSK